MRRFLSSGQRGALAVYVFVTLAGLILLTYAPLDSLSKWWVFGLIVCQFLFFLLWFGAHYRNLHHPLQQMEGVLQSSLEKGNKKTYVQQKLPIYNSLGDKANQVGERLLALEKALERDQRLIALLETSSVGVLLLDAEKKIVFASQSMEHYVGQVWEKGQAFTTQNREAAFLDLVNKVAQSGQSLSEEMEFYSPKEASVKVEVYPDMEKGELQGLLILLTDVTYIRYLEASRANLVANVSHELRTPITSIKGFTETLLDGGLEDEEVARHFLQIIQQESTRLEWLVNDVLNLAKLERAEQLLHVEEVDVALLVKQVCHSFSQKMDSKNLTLQEELLDQFFYPTDAMQFQQIVSNLLSNAIRYTDAGGSVGIRMEEDSQSWQLEVWDTGIGIAEQHLDKIFDRFYRVNKGRSRKQGGSGLGLAIVKEAVEALGASISVQSQLGKGSRFIITFQKQ